MSLESNPLNNTDLPTPEKRRKIEMDDIHTFGNKLEAAMDAIGKTQIALARELGVTPQIVSKWQSGVVLPGEEKLPEIARICEMDLDRLVEDFRISKQAQEMLRPHAARKKYFKPGPDSDVFPANSPKEHVVRKMRSAKN